MMKSTLFFLLIWSSIAAPSQPINSGKEGASNHIVPRILPDRLHLTQFGQNGQDDGQHNDGSLEMPQEESVQTSLGHKGHYGEVPLDEYEVFLDQEDIERVILEKEYYLAEEANNSQSSSSLDPTITTTVSEIDSPSSGSPQSANTTTTSQPTVTTTVTKTSSPIPETSESTTTRSSESTTLITTTGHSQITTTVRSPFGVLNAGQVAGIFMGGIFLMALIASFISWLYFKKKLCFAEGSV